MILVSFPLFVNSSSDADSHLHLCFIKVCLSLTWHYPLQSRYIGCGIFSSVKIYIFAHSLLVAALGWKRTNLWWPCHYLPRTRYFGEAETLSWSRNFTFGRIWCWQNFLTQIWQSCPHVATPLYLWLSPSSQPLYYFPTAVLTGWSTSTHSARHCVLVPKVICWGYRAAYLVCGLLFSVPCTLHHSWCSTLCRVIALVDTPVCSFAVTHCCVHSIHRQSPVPASLLWTYLNRSAIDSDVPGLQLARFGQRDESGQESMRKLEGFGTGKNMYCWLWW